MDVAMSRYEVIEPKRDTLYFRVGSHGLISFHGRNYNIKKRMSSEQRNELMRDADFLRVGSDCYVNLNKISTIADDYLYFGDQGAGCKRLPVSKRKQQIIRQLLRERSSRPLPL
ncbi:LytTR family transcriptional regulator DNA-binding domain-containing protein [Cohnella algarum]|uniref:LytTR family transcriptional regulator DNA-binding domain-containing protein n=1 Tax=Cohnella algarum TaxID=2044859 RepID=UPI001968517B|nr:LytTR family transcriptional regulator DNA-binding domain-containing protein [Cohnella algarum]MBN2984544.1 LytTR family transcriptional regulator DNA-binding domain-containing protein [Cohnella algarum]